MLFQACADIKKLMTFLVGDDLPSEQPGKLYNYFTQGAAVTEVGM